MPLRCWIVRRTCSCSVDLKSNGWSQIARLVCPMLHFPVTGHMPYHFRAIDAWLHRAQIGMATFRLVDCSLSPWWVVDTRSEARHYELCHLSSNIGHGHRIELFDKFLTAGGIQKWWIYSPCWNGPKAMDIMHSRMDGWHSSCRRAKLFP